MSMNVSTMGQVLDNNARLNDIRTQLNTMQIQLASGKKSRTLAGLGSQAATAIQTRAALDQISVFTSNISIGTTRIKQTDQILGEFREQSKDFADMMGLQMQKGEINISSVKGYAHDLMNRLRELVNTRDNDRYILAGADATTKPLTNTGGQDTYMTSLITDWVNGTIDTDALISGYSTTPETTMGYSAPLSSKNSKNLYVRADTSTEVDYTLLANSDGFKEILNAVALMEKMDLDKVSLGEDDDPTTTTTAPGADAEEQKDNFFKIYENVIKRINSGISKLNIEEERLQRAQLQLNQIQADHTLDKNTLENTVGSIEDIDQTEIAVKISTLQIQMTAAYQVTASLGQLTLAAFI